MEPFTAIFDQVIKAIANPENWDNGRLNWNFVDADVFAAIQPKDVEQHYADYEAACVAIEEARCVRFPNTYEKETT